MDRENYLRDGALGGNGNWEGRREGGKEGEREIGRERARRPVTVRGLFYRVTVGYAWRLSAVITLRSATYLLRVFNYNIVLRSHTMQVIYLQLLKSQTIK